MLQYINTVAHCINILIQFYRILLLQRSIKVHSMALQSFVEASSLVSICMDICLLWCTLICEFKATSSTCVPFKT